MALAEIEAARHHYEQVRPDLGNRFAARIAGAIDSMLGNPRMFVVVLNDIRCATIPPFPYQVYYEPLADQVMILGVFHFRRDPRGVAAALTGRYDRS